MATTVTVTVADDGSVTVIREDEETVVSVDPAPPVVEAPAEEAPVEEAPVEAEVTDAGAAAGAEDESATETTDTPAVEAAPADAPAA